MGTKHELHSPPFTISPGHTDLIFEIYIAFSKVNDLIGCFLKSLNWIDLEVEFHLTSNDPSEIYFGKVDFDVINFSPSFKSIGHDKFISLQTIKDNSDDFLHKGSLKV